MNDVNFSSKYRYIFLSIFHVQRHLHCSEIAELMSMKSKHGVGGEYSPECGDINLMLLNSCQPFQELQPEDVSPPAPAPPEDEGAVVPAKPGWRTVHKRAERKEKALAKMAPPAPMPVPAPHPESPRPNLPAWAQWRRKYPESGSHVRLTSKFTCL